MKYVYIAVLVSTLLGASYLTLAVEPSDPKDERARSEFIEKVLRRFKNHKLDREIVGRLSRWKEKPSEKEWNDILSKIPELSDMYSENSLVTISSDNGTEATVKYQMFTNGMRGPIVQAKARTAAVEKMRMGAYYIWAERNGVATSDMNAFFYIGEREEAVMLDEK